VNMYSEHIKIQHNLLHSEKELSMEYKVGQVFTEIPESVAKRYTKVPTFESDNYADTLTNTPNKWVILDIVDNTTSTKLNTREKRYNKKYNSKGFEFRRIVTPTNQLFMGRYNTSLLS
jgi:hypothetical protein